MEKLRRPAVAGQFYTDNSSDLRAEMATLVKESPSRERAIGIIAPHAGYMYSGAVAGEVYGAVVVPSTVVILGPNHHGRGARAALSPHEGWLTPFGVAPVDLELAARIKSHAPIVEDDAVAHQYEHSLEVQVPFIQQVNPQARIVPLCLGFGDFNSCLALGAGLAAAIKESPGEVLIVASSDMTHYESAAAAGKKDQLAMDRILALDPEGLLTTCRKNGISMCGVIPAVVMLLAALELGAGEARLIRYATSGDVTGDRQQVVAYAALTVH